MVGSHVKKDNVSKDTRDLLLCSGLMKAASNDSLEVSISKEGFQFLLLDTNSQIWYFLLYHFEMLKDRPDELVESLKFLLQLNFSVVGQDYPSNNLSITINKLLQNLRELGIVYQRKRSDGRFYPTSLAVSLICASQNSKASKYTSSSTFNNHDKRLGHIIVETNFRVYAYSDSDLQIEVLSLFCDMQYRFPKFCIGIITRDSIRQALKFGITANQIINYLKVHAHPITLKNANPVPMTVSDQIMLWEMEKCRLKFTEGVLYNQFSTRSDFDIIQACAQNINVVEWSSRNKRVLIVSKDGHDEVKKFWKSHKSSP
ncbi:general transcription factor IIH subunit 4-like isoform X2 [Gordionus sp. m RMFG-2023]